MDSKKLKLVFYSPSFLPTVGGLENVMYDWAFQLSKMGHEILVITEREGNGTDNNFPFTVYRKIPKVAMWQLMRKSDAVIHFNISLKTILPAIFSFKPFFVSHHSTLKDINNNWTKLGRLKHFLTNNLTQKNICCSNYVASFLRNTTVVYSPYKPNIFKAITNFAERKGDIVFAGRLVSDKGCDVLLKSLVVLRKKHGLSPQLTIAGDGADLQKLKSFVAENELDRQINFIGSISSEKMAAVLNESKIIVVPSIWEEPFGIVALEGIACGCHVVVSKAGGLPEAVGTFGYQFEKGNEEELATVLQQILSAQKAPDIEGAKGHLEKFTDKHTAQQFVEAIHHQIK